VLNLRNLARQVAKALSAGRPDAATLGAADLVAQSGVAAEIIAALFQEMRRDAPDHHVIGGCAFLLGNTLDHLRIATNGGSSEAPSALERARQTVVRELEQGCDDPKLLMLIVRAFAHAQIDPGESLRRAVMDAMAGQAESNGAFATPADAEAELSNVAKALDHDPFAIHAEISLSAAAFSPKQRLDFVAGMAGSTIPAIREAALGFVLDPDAAVARAVLDVLVGTAGRAVIPSTLVERLVRMRPWVTQARRPAIDSALRALRPKAVQPVAASSPEIKTLLVTLTDGAGAQSVFALAKLGRRHVVASVLTKAGIGIAEALLGEWMSKTEADGLVRMIKQEADARPVSAQFIERFLAAALATNLAQGHPPPFGFVQVLEVLGLGALHPAAQPVEQMAEALLAGRPQGGTPVGVDPDAMLMVAETTLPILASWFEAGEKVETLLAQNRSRKGKISAIFAEILPVRREFWSERCAWTAAVLLERPSGTDWLGIFFAQAALDFAGTTPLSDIPLARVIAHGTVDAQAAARPPRARKLPSTKA
jgi:hypothetical protein